MYTIYILALKELVLLYIDQQNYEIASKYNDLLEEENLDFLGLEDKIELTMAKADLLDNQGMNKESLQLLLDIEPDFNQNLD